MPGRWGNAKICRRRFQKENYCAGGAVNKSGLIFKIKTPTELVAWLVFFLCAYGKFNCAFHAQAAKL
jgi:hypothetical protein